MPRNPRNLGQIHTTPPLDLISHQKCLCFLRLTNPISFRYVGFRCPMLASTFWWTFTNPPGEFNIHLYFIFDLIPIEMGMIDICLIFASDSIKTVGASDADFARFEGSWRLQERLHSKPSSNFKP